MKNDLTPFGKCFRDIRKEKNLTLIKASKKIGISKTYLSLLERGEKDIPSGFQKRLIKSLDLNSEQIARIDIAIKETPCHRRISLCDLEHVLINFLNNTVKTDEERKQGLEIIEKEINKLRQ